MYGVNAPQGFIPSRYRNQAVWSGGFNRYPIASGYNTNIFKNDPVAFAGNGVIGIGAVGATWLGIFQGVAYFTASGQYVVAPYWPAGTVTQGTVPAVAQVIDDPEVVYEVQTNLPNGGGAPAGFGGLDLTFVGKNAQAIAGAGNPLTGLSGWMLDGTTPPAAGNPTWNLKILSLGDSPLNFPQGVTANTTLAFNTCLVLINNHQFRAGTPGV
jgi:hypothetical protein